jgi:hypothetical protein
MELSSATLNKGNVTLLHAISGRQYATPVDIISWDYVLDDIFTNDQRLSDWDRRIYLRFTVNVVLGGSPFSGTWVHAIRSNMT